MAKFQISQRKNGDFQFNLKAKIGQIILSSQEYLSINACENGIASVQKNAQNDAMFERLIASNEKHYFNLKFPNGQIIGTSQMYTSTSGMEVVISSVKENAHQASTEMINE